MDLGLGNAGAKLFNTHTGTKVEVLESNKARAGIEITPLGLDCDSWTGKSAIVSTGLQQR